MLAGPAAAGCTNYPGSSPCGADGLMDFGAPRNPAPRSSFGGVWDQPQTLYVVPAPLPGTAPNWRLVTPPAPPPGVPGSVWVPGNTIVPKSFYGPR